MQEKEKDSRPGVSTPGKIAIVYFVVGLLLAMWPIYPFFSRIRPFVLGFPFSLAYLIGILTLTFVVLLSLYLWEKKTGELE